MIGDALRRQRRRHLLLHRRLMPVLDALFQLSPGVPVNHLKIFPEPSTNLQFVNSLNDSWRFLRVPTAGNVRTLAEQGF